MPSMLNMADVMADSGYTEEAVFDCGISGQIVFLVVVPMLGSCRVPIEALAHFVAGADDYTAEGMPEHWSGSLSGKWTIKRDRLRILGSSWNIFSDDCAKLAEAWAAATPAPSIDDGFDVPLAEQYKLNARLSIATGRCTLHEAAEIFSIEAGEHNEVILSKLEAAARSGLLPVFDPGRNMRREYRDSTRVRVFDVEVFCDDLNKWLDANEPRVSYRFPVSLVVAPSTAPVAAEGFAFDMVATRQQLIDAFGVFTGMDMAWFDNLNDTPKLKAARKYTGQGGRGGAEPLFCPYEVMQWLVDPKRKKGGPLCKQTAWRRLKGSFGNVYDVYSIGDQNAD